jgi:REP element-mobilizing transposase RayT
MHRQPDPPRIRNFKCRQVYHVYQRGSQRQNTFHKPDHLLLYLDRLDLLARRYKVRIHAFCLMSNHVHFMFEPLRRGAVSRLMQHLQSYHARYMNSLKGTEGHLWRNHFHAKHLKSSAQYRNTLLYIEQNPTAAGVARQAHLYPYSSAPAHAAEDPVYRLTHRHREIQVRLYLDRWRKEFDVAEDTDWASWLRSPRLASHLQEVARLIGKPPQPAVTLPEPSSLAITARSG